MTDFLSDLPRDILLLIVKELYPLDPGESSDDLWRWSYTSTFFEHFITPLIIDVVDLRCDEGWGCWLEEIASGPYGHLIKKIRFDVKIDDCDEFEELSNPAEILPESVGTVLSNLHLFPFLELLSIRFCDSSDEDLDDAIDEAESEAQIGEAEEKEGRRALMASVYRALSQNEKIYTKGLELSDVSFERASPFADQSFHNFLSYLQMFSLSLSAGIIDFNEEFQANRCFEYVEFASKLDIIFFDHLSHVTSLTIKALERGILGDRENRPPLALRQDHMPHLKHVDLEYMIVYTGLTDFLVGHAATLEQVILRECFVEQEFEDEYWREPNDFHWEHFFDSLRNAGCSKLRRLEILPVFPPFTWTEYMSQNKELPILQDPGPGQRLFAYLDLHPEEGWASPNIEFIHVSLKEGKDQISYDRLMQMVDANCHEESSSTKKRRRLEYDDRTKKKKEHYSQMSEFACVSEVLTASSNVECTVLCLTNWWEIGFFSSFFFHVCASLLFSKSPALQPLV